MIEATSPSYYLELTGEVRLLTIEIILLPVIYIVGNYYIEELIKKQYEKEFASIEEKAIELGDRYLKEKYLNNMLKLRLKNETKKK